MTPAALLDEAIHALASALNVKPIPGSGSLEEEYRKARRRDFDAQARRRVVLLAASLGREACAVETCPRLAHDDDWCHAHWPDDVAIERAMAGEQVPLMPHERAEAIRRLHASGRGPSEISTRLRVSGETIANALDTNAQEAAA